MSIPRERWLVISIMCDQKKYFIEALHTVLRIPVKIEITFFFPFINSREKICPTLLLLL